MSFTRNLYDNLNVYTNTRFWSDHIVHLMHGYPVEQVSNSEVS